MELERQQQAAQIFQSLLEKPTSERDAAMDAACGGDDALRAMVTSLLAMDDAPVSGMFDMGDMQLSEAGMPTPAPASATLSPGQVVDRYVVEQRLGVGGMAEVWAVRHQTLGTSHALKVLLWASEVFQKRLLREGRAQARLVHENILPVRDILDLAGTPALLMPLIEGPSLDRLLKQHRPTTDEALALFSDILAGIGHAHSQGIIHRDLKPANILLALRHGQIIPLVADFGLVKDLGSVAMTTAGVVMGTPAYASPEQLEDASTTDARADIFSLGVLLCELLSGHRPFDADTLADICDAHLRPPDLSGVPAPMVPLLAEMLQPDPRDRPASCAAIQARLPAHTADLEALQMAIRGLKRPAADASKSLTTLPAPNNLPRTRDRFIGRATEKATLRQWVGEDRRLVTVVGTGGAGKTRLCLEVAHAALMERPDGVWWVDLSEVTTLEGMLVAVGRALGDALPDPTPEAVQLQLIARKECLLILDNFEQISHLAARTVGGWLDAVPDTTFLVTSRHPLRLRGERIFAVSPLDPEAGAALFIERASAINPSLSLSEDDQRDLKALVQLLDGLPLAIELAAARARLLSPARLLKRLSRRFDLLTSRSQDLPARQRTLRATLEWSWDLLSPAEQSCLAQCSVFEGGFTVEAAEEVVDLSDFEDDPWVEDVLAELLDRSLLVSTEHRAARQTRLSMLVSVQEFAGEKLTDRRTVATRHSRHFARLGTEAALKEQHQHRGQAGQAAWRLEVDNVRAAVAHATTTGDHLTACDAVHALMEMTFQSGPLPMTRKAIEGVLAIWPQPPDAEYTRLVWGLGILSSIIGSEDEALRRFEEGLRLCAQIGPESRWVEARLRHSIGYLCARLHRFEESEAHLTVGLALTEDAPRRWMSLRARLLGGMGNLYRRSDRARQALPLYQESVRIRREYGPYVGVEIQLNNLALAHRALGEHDEARRCLTEALELAREHRAMRTEATILNNLANGEDDIEQSLGWYQQAYDLAMRTGGMREKVTTLHNLSTTLRLKGDLAEAHSQNSEALTLVEESGQRSFLANLIVNRAHLLFLREPPDVARPKIVQWLTELPDAASSQHGGLHTLLSLLSTTAEEEEEHLQRAVALLQGGRDYRSCAEAQMRLWAAQQRHGSTDTPSPALPDRLSPRDARDLGLLLLCLRGGIALHRGDPDAARALLSASRGMAGSAPYALRRELAALEEALGEAEA